MSSQLLYYQSMICQYASQYIFDDVLLFDRNFRIRIANGLRQGLRWDRYDNELVARFLRTFKPICYNCRKFGHYVSACPSASSPLTTLNHQSQPPFLAPQRTNPRQASTYDQPTRQLQPLPINRQPHLSPANRQLQLSPANRQQLSCYYFNQFGRCEKFRCTYSHSCETCGGNHGKSHCPGRSRRQ